MLFPIIRPLLSLSSVQLVPLLLFSRTSHLEFGFLALHSAGVFHCLGNCGESLRVNVCLVLFHCWTKLWPLSLVHRQCLVEGFDEEVRSTSLTALLFSPSINVEGT